MVAAAEASKPAPAGNERLAHPVLTRPVLNYIAKSGARLLVMRKRAPLSLNEA